MLKNIKIKKCLYLYQINFDPYDTLIAPGALIPKWVTPSGSPENWSTQVSSLRVAKGHRGSYWVLCTCFLQDGKCTTMNLTFIRISCWYSHCFRIDCLWWWLLLVVLAENNYQFTSTLWSFILIAIQYEVFFSNLL